MLTTHELENVRRSAAMAPLSQDQTLRLIEGCRQLLDERQRIAAVLADLPTSVTAFRVALNELHRILG